MDRFWIGVHWRLVFLLAHLLSEYVRQCISNDVTMIYSYMLDLVTMDPNQYLRLIMKKKYKLSINSASDRREKEPGGGVEINRKKGIQEYLYCISEHKNVNLKFFYM